MPQEAVYSVGQDQEEGRDPKDEERRAQRLDAFGMSLARTRSEAIEGRQASGIELEWEEDEEFYEGIDDATRGEFRAWRTKPPGREFARSEERPTSSTIFINITRPYVDAAAARVGDMLMPTDDKAWDIKPTPIPELEPFADGGEVPNRIRSAIRERFAGDEQAEQGEIQRLQAIASEKMEEAKEIAKKASKRIEDWHVECQYQSHMRKVIDDCAKVGSGVLKGPVPVKRKRIAYRDGEITVVEEINPSSLRIDYRNLFPDPSCGENIQNGSHTWERDDITRRRLAELKGGPGYIDSQIDKVLREGPSIASKLIPERPDDVRQTGVGRQGKNLFEIWYFHGMAEQEDIQAAGCKCEDDTYMAPVQITMVNNRVIRVAMNPVDTGDYPYDIMVWSARDGMPWGRGVARQIRTPQRMVNGAGRNMMDNAGRAGGPMLVYKPGLIEPANGIHEITPWKIWFAGEDADLEHLENAMRFLVVPMLQAELQAIIMLGLKLAEDTTGLPMLLQGQLGERKPETLGQTQILDNRASGVLRRVAKLYDDRMTEPHIRRYYAYVMVYGEDGEKGDMQIDARGSTALVERDMQTQFLAQMGAAFLDPRYKKDPAKWADEMLKSQRLDPKTFDYDDEEWQKLVAQLSEKPQDHAIEVAQIRAEVEKWKMLAEAKRDREKMAHESQENEQDRALEMATRYLDQELESAKLAGDDKISIDQLKTKLADTAMKLRTQRQLSVSNQITKPPTEPAGKASPGRAYQE